jgi:hypothetical protein
MTELFRKCREVLDQRLIPLHYAELTKLALVECGLTKRDVNWSRQIEDVREKMLLAGQHETFYIGAPYCLAGVRWWFQSEQLRMFHPSTGVFIPGSAQSGADGAFNALMRDPDLKVKTNAPVPRIKRGRANGFVIEQHVADWFKHYWPKFYIAPDNEGQWKRWCDHDFKLVVDGVAYKVDVSGKRLNGTHGNSGQGKKRIDFHLLCELIDRDVLWSDVRTGATYNKVIISEQGGIWPERLIVWLNCRHNGIDYKAIKDHVNNQEVISMAA